MNKITVVCHKDHSYGYEDFEDKCLLCVVDDLMLEIGNLMVQKRRAEKREWVGLTDEEHMILYTKANSGLHAWAKAIEAKLKEKNSG